MLKETTLITDIKASRLQHLPKIVVLFAFLLITVLFASCKKGSSPNPKTLITDSTKSNVALNDTGSTTSGATMVAAMYTGSVSITSFTSSPPLILSNQHDMVISGTATSRISLFNCYNITIKNCEIGPNTTLSGINLNQCTNINIDSCYLYNVSTGIFATDSKTISVTNCQAKNMLGPFPQGQFVQFKNVSGGGNRVSFNKFENILGESYTEDAISMYASNGLPTDPIVIESNWIRGGGPSHSGGGIMLGDGGGSNMIAKNNFLVDPGEYGMAVSGGTDMCIINNSIYAKSQSFTNVGVYYRNYSGPPSINIRIAKNAINYTNSKSEQNDILLGPGDQAPMGWSTNIYSPGLSETTLPASILSESIFPSSAGQ